MQRKQYYSPQLEILDICVEGSILQGSADVGDWGDGGSLGGGDAEETFL